MKFEITRTHKDTLYFTLVPDDYRLILNKYTAKYNLFAVLSKDVADKFTDMGAKVRQMENRITCENDYLLGPIHTPDSYTLAVYSVDGDEPKPFDITSGLPEHLRANGLHGTVTIDGSVHYHKASDRVVVYAKKLTFEF